MDTDITGGALSQERRDEMIADLVVDRLGTVDDAAAVIEFHLAEPSGQVTGTTYDVNGGLVVD